LLEHYEEKNYLYGRRAQDLKAHTAALLRKYMKKAEENMMHAALQREMTREQAQRDLNSGLCTRLKDVRMDRTGAAGNDRLRSWHSDRLFFHLASLFDRGFSPRPSSLRRE
jgi:hypothetical protein